MPDIDLLPIYYTATDATALVSQFVIDEFSNLESGRCQPNIHIMRPARTKVKELGSTSNCLANGVYDLANPVEI